MSNPKRMGCGTALAMALGLMTVAVSHAAEPVKSPVQGRESTAAAPTVTANQPQTTPVGERPLMRLLDDAGIGRPLRDAHINIYGHAEGSITHNFSKPNADINPFRIFDLENDEPTFNQFDFTVERLVDYRKNEFDVGGRVEMLYGADAGFLHSNGLFDWYDSPRDPENQWDLLQAYVDVAVPVGTGLRIRAGKFVNFVGYETVNPTASGVVDFYSRSLIFFQYPFTHTGILATYDITRDVTINAGVTRGDNQSTEDNNDAVSFLGSINWVINHDWALYLANSTGPEQPDNSRDLRTTWDATLYYTPSREFQGAFNIYYVWEENGSNEGDDDGQLVALALLGSYQLNDMIALKGRVEWMHDDDGFRLGGDVNNIYEVTAGLTIRPFPRDQWLSNIKIRPEVRYDWSDEDAFNGKKDQFTGAIDMVVTF